ncbi:class I SAM-dependent methyltransferase [Saliphagus infecundisoli]|uniref:Class I SAM-dependent methyltransferase n=1 Tax=Saliphagus infecundisoli TaxID=1849069 RepID=A0ABD5QFV0_9EURY|nr:class I SAM-dependent methyltransferase [Saliphagus infecundisoli]
MSGSFRRYLEAKRTVDDRALDRRLLSALREGLAARADREGPLSVLEVGAGIGTMVMRLLEWEVLPPGETVYTAVDVREETAADVTSHLREYARGDAATVETRGDRIVVETADRRVAVEAVAADALAFVERDDRSHDLLIGAALLDVFDLSGLEPLLRAVAPGGYYYFPITFDGATRFRPAHPDDGVIERRYHEHMDHKPGGSARAGGDVLERLRAMEGMALTGVAGSDWIVRPSDGAYPADEAYFLGHILDTVESAVGETIDGDEPLSSWMNARRDQLEAGELSYLTHQLDFLGQVRNR